MAECLLPSFHVLSQLGLSVLLEKLFFIQGVAVKGDTSESFVWIDFCGMAMDGPEKSVGVQVVSFKDMVVMKTVRISFRKEVYVKML